MLQYQVIQIDESDYRGKETVTLKWIFDNFEAADKLAKFLYNNNVEYYKSDTTYNEVERGVYREFQQADWGWKEAVASYIVNEIEFEMNSEIDVELG